MAGIGDNSGDLAAQIEAAFSIEQLSADHDALASEAQDLGRDAKLISAVDDPAQQTEAAAMVIKLREMTGRLEREHDTIKRPVWEAGKNVTAFFKGVADGAGLAMQKSRLEKLGRDYSFRVAAEARRKAEETAAAEREKARLAAEAAAKAEAENRPVVADVIMEAGIRAENMAEAMEGRAAGPVQELARVRTPVATAGLRQQPGFEIEDLDALTASLGPLGPSLPMDAIHQAIRKHRVNNELAKWDFESDDQHSPKRYVVAKPAIPGVRYFLTYEGSIRA